ncbi:hypothetical protein CIT25_16035 [Mesorhizobium mediterraneum]|uniref:Uncharacterized protein n=1 Tax=Mesorhizobium mediterraneum TaxID=43617 RepID=A0AB36RB40_9HYPH|nr:hypothetical protein CIT25_16035 [Mesorhizobium mediterraneum]
MAVGFLHEVTCYSDEGIFLWKPAKDPQIRRNELEYVMLMGAHSLERAAHAQRFPNHEVMQQSMGLEARSKVEPIKGLGFLNRAEKPIAKIGVSIKNSVFELTRRQGQFDPDQRPLLT